MKKLFKLATVAAAFTLGASVANASDKLGFVDPAFLMQHHPLTIESSQKFNEFMKNNQAKFEEQNKALVAEEQKLVAENNRLLEKRKSLDADFKKFSDDAQKFEKDRDALESAVKAKMAELDKNTRLSTKQKNAELEKSLGKRMQEIQNRGNALQKRQNDLANKAKPFEDEGNAFQKKIAAFEEKRKAFEENISKANKEATGLDPQDVQQKVLDSINETIKKVAKEKGYTVIFPMTSAPIYAADENADLTDEVLLAFGGKLPEAPKAAEKPAEGKADEAKPAETKPAEAK